MDFKSLLLICFLISSIVTQPYEYCEDKAILKESGYDLADTYYADKTLAFTDFASCASLKPKAGDDYACCYLKIKFKNELLDEKYTHKGCYAVSTNTVLDEDKFDSLFESLEDHEFTNPDAANSEDNMIVYKSVSLDCSSKFIQLAGLALLFLLL